MSVWFWGTRMKEEDNKDEDKELKVKMIFVSSYQGNDYTKEVVGTSQHIIDILQQHVRMSGFKLV